MAARGLLALLLARHAASCAGALDASDLSYLAWRRPSDTERAQFWADARTSSNLTVLANDTSLPPVAPQPGYFFRVAVCITGGARGFPLKSYGLYDSIKANLVEALGANQTDIFCACLRLGCAQACCGAACADTRAARCAGPEQCDGHGAKGRHLQLQARLYELPCTSVR
jgi:hypothetical protein